MTQQLIRTLALALGLAGAVMIAKTSGAFPTRPPAGKVLTATCGMMGCCNHPAGR